MCLFVQLISLTSLQIWSIIKQKTIVTAPDERRFETLVVGHDRSVDSEYKLFEHAAMIAEDGKAHEIVMLSEKSMCESCQFVMQQFKEKYPNVKVNVVSHKKKKSQKNRNQNPIFKIDVELRYKHENN